MTQRIVGVPDKKLAKQFLEGKEYIIASDEGEAVAIAAGHYLATGEKATVFTSADGFCNCLNFLTSWIIPDKIPIHMVISYGRQEPPHKVMTDILHDIIKLLPDESKAISYEFVQ